MSTIQVQKENNPQTAVTQGRAREWDPFRAMRELMRWEPFAELAPAWQRLEAAPFAPSFEVKENKEAFVFTADVPGVKEGDLDVRLTQNRLSISGKRESEKIDKGDQFYAAERSYGSFTRSFTLPDGIQADKIAAELKGGVLTLTVPKRPEALPKKIDVATK